MTTLYDDIAGADVQSRGQAIDEDGDWVVETGTIRVQESNRGHGTLWVVEYTIREGGTEKHPNGATRSWVQFPTRRGQTDPGNIKAHILACLGTDPVDARNTSFEGAAVKSVAEDQVLYGALVRLQTKCIETKGGYPFTVHSWAPVKDGKMVRGSESAAPETSPWQPHPSEPGWEWNPATREVRRGS